VASGADLRRQDASMTRPTLSCIASAGTIGAGVSIVLDEGVEGLLKPGHCRTAHDWLAATQRCR
jgi:hypothetical protein